jgi:thioredoxin reductase (NADPH)
MRDVIVVGAGPVGLACALEAKRRGLDALVVEKGAVVNSFIGYPTGLEFFSTPGLLEIGGHPFSTQRRKPIREEALDYYRGVARAEALDLALYEQVQRLDGSDGAFRVVTGKGVPEARKVILATGFFDLPNPLGAEGETLDKVTHYFKEPYPYAGQDVLVVGGANSAAKAALACHRHDARVTMAALEDDFDDGLKYWIRPDVENRIAEGAITAHFSTAVERITEERVLLDGPDGRFEIENDFVLAMTGYRPDYDLFDTFGIAIADDPARTPVHDEETFETNRDGLYLAGTVAGGLNTSRWFIENGREHAQQVADDIARKLERAPVAA